MNTQQIFEELIRTNPRTIFYGEEYIHTNPRIALMVNEAVSKFDKADDVKTNLYKNVIKWLLVKQQDQPNLKMLQMSDEVDILKEWRKYMDDPDYTDGENWVIDWDEMTEEEKEGCFPYHNVDRFVTDGFVCHLEYKWIEEIYEAWFAVFKDKMPTHKDYENMNQQQQYECIGKCFL